MANDALFLHCTKCGSVAMIAKYYPGEAFTAPDVKQRLDALFEKCADRMKTSSDGLTCCGFGGDLEGHPYELLTEGELGEREKEERQKE